MRPRILFLVPADYAALQRKGVARLILERDEHGFFERVLTVHPIAERSQVIDLTPAHRLIEFDFGRALAPGAAPWTALAAPLRALALVPRLAALVRAERIDLIRANDPYLMGLVAWCVARLTRRPFCVSVHADYQKNFELTPKRGWAKWLRRLSAWSPRFVFRRADLVLPIRHHLARWARHEGAPPDRVRVIPHGVDLARFAAPFDGEEVRRSYGIAPGAPIVSFVGRLSDYNYVGDVLDVAERILARRPDVVFVLVGDGEERDRLERRIAASPGLAGGIRLLGSRPPGEVVRIRRASAVSLCLMAGLSLLEACAAGSAVIAYDVDWHREIVTPDVTGILVAERQVDAAANAVERLLADPALAARLGGQARAFVQAHHDERVTSSIKQACYAQLLGTGSAA